MTDLPQGAQVNRSEVVGSADPVIQMDNPGDPGPGDDEYDLTGLLEPGAPTSLYMLARIADALERIASLLAEPEQPQRPVLAPINGGVPAQQPGSTSRTPIVPTWTLGQQPQVNPAADPATGLDTSWLCPIHGQNKVVPGGFSQRTGRNYSAFVACPVQGCNQKPPRQ